MPIRSPICAIEGHVDHGKTSLLDKIRGSSVAKGEAGAITQAIGASIIPIETIKKLCGALLETLKIKLTIPGLLFIDTPGHAAFTALRKRGGNLADIAIVVIDLNEGIMPQTKEAIEILRTYKTPFIIALNKIDLIKGYAKKSGNLLQNLSSQPEEIKQKIDTKLYELVGKLYEMGFESERFDRVNDYTKQIAIIPLSAKTGDGIPELLMVLTGLAQKYLEQCLKCNTEGPAKGIILEVKEDKGLGTTMDTIIYDGTLKINDILVIAGLETPIVTKVKALLQPSPLAEMREKKTKFSSVKQATASTGVKISAPDIEHVVAGMPLQSCKESEIESVKESVQKEAEEVLIKTEKSGIIVKADNLGSLEAIGNLLKEKNIPVQKASIGDITKKDISEAESMLEEDPLKAAILGFNVKLTPDAAEIAKQSKAKLIISDVIYRLIEDIESWQQGETKRYESEKLEKLIRPCKLHILKGYIFRQSNPAVFGVEVTEGTLKSGILLMKTDGTLLKPVKSIQHEQEAIDKAEKGKQVAVAMQGITVGRQLNEGDILLSDIPEEQFKKLKELKSCLSKPEVELLKEIAEIKRKENPTWGI